MESLATNKQQIPFTMINIDIWRQPWIFTKQYGLWFMYLIRRAAIKPQVLSYCDIIIKRGQIGESILSLSERMETNRKKYRIFLDFMAQIGELEYHTNNKGTIITIINYDYWTAQSGTSNNPAEIIEIVADAEINISKTRKNGQQLTQQSAQQLTHQSTQQLTHIVYEERKDEKKRKGKEEILIADSSESSVSSSFLDLSQTDQIHKNRLMKSFSESERDSAWRMVSEIWNEFAEWKMAVTKNQSPILLKREQFELFLLPEYVFPEDLHIAVWNWISECKNKSDTTFCCSLPRSIKNGDVLKHIWDSVPADHSLCKAVKEKFSPFEEYLKTFTGFNDDEKELIDDILQWERNESDDDGCDERYLDRRSVIDCLQKDRDFLAYVKDQKEIEDLF